MAQPTILVIDDDPVVLKLLEVNFEMEGFTVLVARDGVEGFEMAKSEQPDVVLSDIMMPKRSGLELVTVLRDDPETAEIPILLLSAKAQSADVRSGLDAGADDYVTKPFEPLELVERVNRLIELRRSRFEVAGRDSVIRDELARAVREALAAEGLAAPEVVRLERPARRDHGDWSTNVALALAKSAGRTPRDLATALAGRLQATPPPHVEQVEVAGPGFVNFHLRPSWLHDVLRDVVAGGEDGYARLDLGHGRRVNVEFVSANPTGPLHAGGGRWAAYGDALCNVLARTGFEPHREYYLNDRGTQMELFAASLAAAKAGTPPPEGGYAGEYLREWAAEMPDGADPAVWGYERVKQDLAATLERLGVRFDTWFSERSMVESGAIEATLLELRERGVVYEAEGAVWLRTTDYGDDKDRVIVRSDGEPTYVLPDIAYHRDKFSRGFDLLVDVWGADHHGYRQRLRAGMQALGHDPAELEIILGQLVDLVRDGQQVKLSKRAGDLVLLDDLLDTVGPDVARLTFLLQSLDTRQTIDLDLVTSQSMENPVYYVQYAHARIHSIERVAAERSVARRPLDEVDLPLLAHERELDVLRSLAELPDALELACTERAPHRVSTWVRELAGRFHGFYHDCYVLSDDVPPELTQARLWLVEAARIGLAVGLGLLGVSAPESM